MTFLFFRLCCLAVLFLPLVSQANFTTTTITQLTHPKPEWFAADGAGGFYGATEGGLTFSQRVVATGLPIRLHKFTIGEAYFYISDRGVLWAADDLTAVSMYLARA